jgi:hypothetical protein
VDVGDAHALAHQFGRWGPEAIREIDDDARIEVANHLLSKLGSFIERPRIRIRGQLLLCSRTCVRDLIVPKAAAQKKY